MRNTLLLIFSLLLLAACGEAAPAAEPPSEPIDLATLPKSIDVQTAAALQDNADVVMIDVREQWEYDEGRIPNITLIPMSEIQDRIAEIPTDKTVIVSCQVGGRSRQIFDWLTNNGYDNVHNLDGGFAAWERAGYEVEK